MADYSQKSLDLLDEIDRLEAELKQVYLKQSRRGTGPDHAAQVARLHQRINLCLKQADIYALHALRQQLQASTADQLAHQRLHPPVVVR